MEVLNRQNTNGGAMTRQDGLSQWITTVSTNMPHLSKPQATVLALWSFGIACTRSCGRDTVATFLALLLNQKVANLDQRLYEWCLDAADKTGTKRVDIAVTACFVPLLAWIVRLWSGTRLALTIDATSLGDRFVVLAICAVYRGCAIPVTWTILPAGQKRAWRREWLRMLRLLRPAIPRDWTILVLADRGLYARWLFRRIVRLGGIRSCASISVANSVPLGRRSLSGYATSSGKSACAGADRAPPLPHPNAISTAPSSRGGATVTPNPGVS
jgi:hypothetical protein